MLAEFATAVSTIKALSDAAKTIKDLSARTAFEAQIGELLGQVTAAHERTVAAQARETLLSKRVELLEKEKLELENWATQEKRYKLTDYGGGTFAYLLQPGMEQGEAPHRLCRPCFEERRRGFLHSHGDFNGREKVICDVCDKIFMLGVGRPPQVHRTKPRDYDPFR